ncbi:MAG: tRNA lysidine(34) synthetase TilS [Halobacteriovoraceae bacterium]|nr:tRNA lysidine(34) synthetase TilS [Halobacteriovoraceae bacterium]|tara:strand:+ start:203036 stop:204301 length:1266 start_codon:yes stop_codon:yes gene_type:complete
MESFDRAFTNRFEKHVHSFIKEHKLLKGQDHVLVAVSGGVDSIAALMALNNIENFGYSFQLQAIFINHGTRKGQSFDQKLVQNFCSGLGVELLIEELEGLSGKSNFEAAARRARYKCFKKHLSRNSLLILGHHINDSFEWSLMQSLRSSSLKGQLGIPVINGQIVRPFMCVTREQIYQYAKAYNLPFNEDPTNQDTSFERNFIRNEISSRLRPRYPAMLKHYVRSHNELARTLGLHITKSKECSFKRISVHEGVHLISYSSQFDPSGLEEELKIALNELSPNSRGSVSHQIDKIVKALKNYKSGPFNLPGGLWTYLSFNHIFISKSQLPSDLFNWSEYNLGLEEFKELIAKLVKEGKVSFPIWTQVSKPGFNIEYSKSHPLLPEQNELVGKGVVPGLKLVKYWTRARNKNKKLRLRLLLSL